MVVYLILGVIVTFILFGTLSAKSWERIYESKTGSNPKTFGLSSTFAALVILFLWPIMVIVTIIATAIDIHKDAKNEENES